MKMQFYGTLKVLQLNNKTNYFLYLIYDKYRFRAEGDLCQNMRKIASNSKFLRSIFCLFSDARRLDMDSLSVWLMSCETTRCHF